MGLLHSSCDEVLLSYFSGFITVCSTGAPLYVQCVRGLLSSFSREIVSSFERGGPSFVAGGSFLVMAKDSSRVVVEDLVFLSSCDR